jgi:putative spermidine/putrescine transport system permease protein
MIRKRLRKEVDSQLFLPSRIAAYVVYLFLILPSVVVIPMSFGNKMEFEFPPSTISLFLYQKFFTDKMWIGSAVQSFYVALGTVGLSLILGVTAAYGLVRGKFPGARFLTIVFLSPMLVPVIVVALGLYLYLSSLRLSGTTLGLILGHTVIATPFVIVTSMAGLRHVDERLETVARVLGANRFITFWKVTLPILRPAIFAGALFAFLISFDEVVIAWFVTSPQTITLPVKMYSSIRWEISPVLAAISTMLTVLSVMICLLVALGQKDK